MIRYVESLFFLTHYLRVSNISLNLFTFFQLGDSNTWYRDINILWKLCCYVLLSSNHQRSLRPTSILPFTQVNIFQLCSIGTELPWRDIEQIPTSMDSDGYPIFTVLMYVCVFSCVFGPFYTYSSIKCITLF